MNTVNDDQEFPHSLNKQNGFNNANSIENGFILNNIYLPEEILLNILSYVDPKQLLKYTLVCRNWNRLIKSYTLWSTIYERKYQRSAKLLPWYLYYCLLSSSCFNANLLLNKEKIIFWTYKHCHPAPGNLKELDIQTDNLLVLIVITSLNLPHYERCGTMRHHTRMQSYHQKCLITLGKSKLFKHILDIYKPHIYLSKCGYMDKFEYGYLDKDMSKESISNCSGTQPIDDPTAGEHFIITQYPAGIGGILFEGNRETNYKFNDLYGNSSVKFLFDSIEPLPVTAVHDRHDETNN